MKRKLKLTKEKKLSHHERFKQNEQNSTKEFLQKKGGGGN